MRARNCMYIFTCFTNKSVKKTGSYWMRKIYHEKTRVRYLSSNLKQTKK